MALVPYLQTRAVRKKPTDHSTINNNQEEKHDISLPSQTSESEVSSSQTRELERIRKSMFHAAEKDNTESLKELLAQMKKVNQKVEMSSAPLRDPDTNATVLHKALLHDALQVSKMLINFKDKQLLLADFEVLVKGIPSKMTCMHILIEKGHLPLINEFLSKLPNGQAKLHFLRKTVLMELEGQRPRHLSSIHIAALTGNTEIVEILVKLGMDVNATNNKNDTPVLWAARNNHIQTVRKLIDLGADVNHENDKGSTPLYWSVRYGFPELLEILIKEGKANIHQRRKLGLVSPIVLASALGYADVLRILLDNGADVHTRITAGMTALHHAAVEGNEDIIRMLIDHGSDVDEADDAGNTALMHAVKGGHMGAIQALTACGAHMDCRNKMGHTIWDHAIDMQTTDLLVSIISTYRKIKRFASSKLTFPVGKTPLHVAAIRGDVDKIKCLLDLGADPQCTDQNGNTYFHVAARDNCIEVLQSFLDTVDPNQQNAEGNTALHLACYSGHTAATEILLKKTKLETVNNEGETALHVAAKSHSSTQEVVDKLVNVIAHASNWSLMDCSDHKGNTALHVAAKAGRADIIVPLHHLNPKLQNDDGDSPLHAAAKTGHSFVLEALLEIFNIPGKGLDIDQQNAQGQSLLHICAKQGQYERVEMLIGEGADLALQDSKGNSVLHTVALKTVTDPNNKDAVFSVFTAIVNLSPVWWCMQKDINCPDEYSELYNTYKKTAMTFLSSNVINHGGMNLVCFATKIGAKDFLDKLLNLEDINRVKIGRQYQYDVTYLMPETTPQRRKRKDPMKASMVGIIDMAGKSKQVEMSSESCLNILVGLEDEVLATQILDIVPIKQLVRSYWKTYQWIYGLLMFLHITYMGLLSAFSIPMLQDSLNASRLEYDEAVDVFPPVLFLVWPALLLFFEVYFFFSQLGWCANKFSGDGEKADGGCNTFCSNPLSVPFKLFSLLFSYLSHVISLIFTFLVITWFCLYQLSNFNQVYVLAVALIVGWIFTIAFTKGFETVHAFSIMLKYIILRDITRFMFIYLFVLLAFAFGLHILFQIAPSISEQYDSAFDTIFLTFNLMIGMDEIFDDDFDTQYQLAGSSSTYVKVTYLIYIILSTIVLLNLLIAMMSDTYNGIKSREGTTWRVGSLRLALQLESSITFLPGFFQAIGVIRNRVKLDKDLERWMLLLPMEAVEVYKAVEVDEMLKAVNKLDSKVIALNCAHADLSKKIDLILSLQEQGDDGFTDLRPAVTRRMSIFPGQTGRPKMAAGRHPRVIWRRALQAQELDPTRKRKNQAGDGSQ